MAAAAVHLVAAAAAVADLVGTMVVVAREGPHGAQTSGGSRLATRFLNVVGSYSFSFSVVVVVTGVAVVAVVVVVVVVALVCVCVCVFV